MAQVVECGYAPDRPCPAVGGDWPGGPARQKAALAAPQNTAHPAIGKLAFFASMKAKVIRGGFSRTNGVHPPHPSYAKKAAAFLGMSPFAGKTIPRNVFRSGSDASAQRSHASASTRRGDQPALTRLADITRRTQPPRQCRQPDAQTSAVSRRFRPRVSARRTASRRNSGVGLFAFPMEHLLVPQLVLATFSGQVHAHPAGNQYSPRSRMIGGQSLIRLRAFSGVFPATA